MLTCDCCNEPATTRLEEYREGYDRRWPSRTTSRCDRCTQDLRARTAPDASVRVVEQRLREPMMA
jgi:hypothetical protein